MKRWEFLLSFFCYHLSPMPIFPPQKDIYPDDLLDRPEEETGNDERQWRALWTRPRQEKALMRAMGRLELPYYGLLQKQNAVASLVKEQHDARTEYLKSLTEKLEQDALALMPTESQKFSFKRRIADQKTFDRIDDRFKTLEKAREGLKKGDKKSGGLFENTVQAMLNDRENADEQLLTELIGEGLERGVSFTGLIKGVTIARENQKLKLSFSAKTFVLDSDRDLSVTVERGKRLYVSTIGDGTAIRSENVSLWQLGDSLRFSYKEGGKDRSIELKIRK